MPIEEASLLEEPKIVVNDSIAFVISKDISIEVQSIIKDLILTNFDPKVLSYQGRWSFESNELISTFIPLSDVFPFAWDVHPDSVIIDSAYMQEYDDNRNYHILSDEKRSLVLFQSGILESDSIFIFCLAEDSIVRFRVKDVPMIAMINIYGSSTRIWRHDFQFGFEFESKPFSMSEQSYIYATTCAINPFVEGGIKPIEWEKMDSARFPETPWARWDTAFVRRNRPLECFHFIDGELEYMLQNWGRDSVAGARKVVVISTETNEVLYSAMFRDSEGTSLIPLNTNETVDFGGFKFQQTGFLFKKKPPVIYGFLSFSFGCPGMGYIGSEGLKDSAVKGLRIHCDNRH